MIGNIPEPTGVEPSPINNLRFSIVNMTSDKS